MERILLDVSFWEINFIDITKLKPENYINFWRLINTEQYQFGEEHVNIASSLANIFVGQDLFPLFEEFLREIDSEKLRLLKKDEQFLRALIKLKMHENSFSEVYSLIQEGKFTNPENLIEVWDDAHYREKALVQGPPLTALEKFRIRKRNPPPPSICPEGRPVKTIPGSSREILKKWYNAHIDDPYPSKLMKQKLAAKSGLTVTQVKTWFSNARRTGRRKLLSKKKENKSKSKPVRKSKTVSKNVKEWKLNKLPVVENSINPGVGTNTQDAHVLEGNTGVSLGEGQDKGVHLENQLHLKIFDCSKINKQDTDTEADSNRVAETEPNNLCGNEKKNLHSKEIKNESHEKRDFTVNNKDTSVLKATENTTVETTGTKFDKLESNDTKENTGSRGSPGKQVSESDQSQVTSTTGYINEILNKEQTAEVSINRNIQLLLKNKLEQKQETPGERLRNERKDSHKAACNKKRSFVELECPEYSPDIGSESLAALSVLCNRIEQDTFIPNNFQAESMKTYSKDKVKCRKHNKLEKLKKVWNESLMAHYPSNSVAEFQQSSYQPVCGVKHCNINSRGFQSPTGFSERMYPNYRNHRGSTFPLDSPVHKQHVNQLPSNSYHGYQMLSPKIADEAERKPSHSNQFPDNHRWTASEDAYPQGKDSFYQHDYRWTTESSLYPRSDNGPWAFPDFAPIPQQGYHGYSSEGHSYSDAYQHQHPLYAHSQFYQPDMRTGSETLCNQDTPLNFSSATAQSRNSLYDAVEGLLNLSSSQETD